ncbi:MAG: FkbM family methyltransferase, partial [Cyanobacteria bacterium P01_A01_bin.84]
DRYIIENIKLPEKGIFVDVGAGHPIYLSNTYFFERNGWDGVCIDADKKQVELLKTVRKNVEWAAVAPEEGEIEFFQSLLPELSTTLQKDEYQGLLKSQFKKDTVKVPAFRLETILEKYNIGIIDVLNIDVEGAELDVWQTFNYQKHQPKVVIMEYYTWGLADNADKIKKFFSKLPYNLAHTTCSNFIFVREDICIGEVD